MANYLLPIQVAVGGVVGASLRHLIYSNIGPGWLVLLAINLAGSLVIGWLVGMRLNTDHRIWGIVAIGFCGGLTSFSTYSLQVATHFYESEWLAGLSLAVPGAALIVIAAGVGYRIGSRP